MLFNHEHGHDDDDHGYDRDDYDCVNEHVHDPHGRGHGESDLRVVMSFTVRMPQRE